MSWVGVLGNVAKIGVNLLNQYVNTPSDYEVIVETTDGRKYIRQKSYVLWHPNPAKIGTFIDPPVDEVGALTLTLDSDGDGDNRLWALNNNPSTDALGAFSQTLPSGASNINPIYVPAYDVINPTGVDVTSFFTSSPNSALTATPVTLTSSMLPFAVETVNGQDVVVSTVLANFNVPNIIATAQYVVYADETATILFSWVTNSDGTIVGFTVISTLTVPVAISVNVSVDNPLQSFTVNITVGPGQSVPGTLPSVDRPLTYANISATTGTTDAEFVGKIRKFKVEKQEKEGKMVHFKGRPKLTLKKKTTSSW